MLLRSKKQTASGQEKGDRDLARRWRGKAQEALSESLSETPTAISRRAET